MSWIVTASAVEHAKAVDRFEARSALDAISVLETQGLGFEILHLDRGEVITLLPVHEDAVEVLKLDQKRLVCTKRVTGLGSWLGLRYLRELLMDG